MANRKKTVAKATASKKAQGSRRTKTMSAAQKKQATSTKPRAGTPTKYRRTKQRVIKSQVTKAAMNSSSIWGAYGIGGNEDQVDFSRESGRRGSEVLGLTSGPATTQIINIPSARRRSRHAVLTNPYAKRSVDVLVSNVVGTGHKLRSLAPDKAFRKQVEKLWNEWSDQVDLTGKLSFSAMEALAFRSMLEGGDCFIRFRVRRPEDNLVVPLQLQLIESEQCPIEKMQMAENNPLNSIVAGIEFNLLGQPTAYHLYKTHPGEYLASRLGFNLETVPVPASEVIHLHDMKRPNEVRGWPLLSIVLITLSDMNRYLDAELVRKKAAALIGGFIRTPNDNPDGNPFFADGVDVGQDNEVHIEQMEPGSFPILPPGYEVSFSAPADVGQTFAEFIRQQLLLVCAALNITFEQLSGDLRGANDRTIRASMLEFKRIARQYQKHIMVHQFCRAVFNYWFNIAVISGKLVIPAGMDFNDARKASWSGDPWEYMNPQQEISAQVQNVRAGFVPRSDYIVQQGNDPEEIDEQFAADRDREKSLDLVFMTNVNAVNDFGMAQSKNPAVNLVESGEDVVEREAEEFEKENEGGDNAEA